MLDQLLYEDRKLVDGFDKMMAIYPVEDWPYFRRRRQAMRLELRSQEAVNAIVPNIRAAIEQRGPSPRLTWSTMKKWPGGGLQPVCHVQLLKACT